MTVFYSEVRPTFLSKLNNQEMWKMTDSKKLLKLLLKGPRPLLKESPKKPIQIEPGIYIFNFVPLKAPFFLSSREFWY